MEMIIFAGPNGSGKTTIINEFIKEYNLGAYEYINPDKYAKDYFSHIADENDRYVRAFAYADYKRNKALQEKRNFIIETVNSTTNKFGFYKQCKSMGYIVTVVYVCTNSYEININRVAKRYSQGGHNVPREKIISRYNRSLANLKELCSFADVIYIYDNSRDDVGARLCYYKDKFTIQEEVLPDWIKSYLFAKQ